jgi:hypothetical protein
VRYFCNKQVESTDSYWVEQGALQKEWGHASSPFIPRAEARGFLETFGKMELGVSGRQGVG